MKPSPKPSAFARQQDRDVKPPSLDKLFENNVDVVFGFLMARCGSRQVAEEVSSDTFAEAARVFSLGRGAEVSRGWLLDVARKRLIDHWRRIERRRLRLERFIQFRRTNPGNDNDARACDSAILEALDSLSQRQRAALVLRYLDEYSVSEVAEALEMTYQATESLLARGRRSLLNAYERSNP